MSTFSFITPGDVVYYLEGNILGVVKETFIMNYKRYYFVSVDECGTEMIFKRGEIIKLGEL